MYEGRRLSDDMRRRNDMCKSISKERGVSIPEASKIIKGEGLYKPSSRT